MTTVSGVSSYSTASTYSDVSSTQRRHRPDSAKMAEDLFSKLDTSGKGYIEQSDLTSALSSLSSTSSGSTSQSSSASDIFDQLDSNADGKVTKDELSTSIQKLAESLDSQFDQMRMQGGMPPPPPNDSSGSKGSDSGFSKDELSSQLAEIGSTDSKRSSLISNIVQNFDKADTDSDGKVSFKEAMAYDQASKTSASSSPSTSDSSSSSAGSSAGSSTSTSAATTSSKQSSDAKLFKQLLDLMRTYGDSSSGQSTLSTLSQLVSTSV